MKPLYYIASTLVGELALLSSLCDVSFAQPSSVISRSQQLRRRNLSHLGSRIRLEYDDKCLCVHPEDDKLFIRLLECDDSDPNQSWYYEARTGTVKSTNEEAFGDKTCITEGDSSFMYKLHLAKCDGKSHQSWTYHGGRFHSRDYYESCISRCRHGRVDVSMFVETKDCEYLSDPDQMFQMTSPITTSRTAFFGNRFKEEDFHIQLRMEYDSCLSFDPDDSYRIKVRDCDDYDETQAFHLCGRMLQSSSENYKGMCLTSGNEDDPVMTLSRCIGGNSASQTFIYEDYRFVVPKPIPNFEYDGSKHCITHCTDDFCNDVVHTQECSSALSYQQEFKMSDHFSWEQRSLERT